eukprot:2149403-Heterocapsa_arctica.AAC.1
MLVNNNKHMRRRSSLHWCWQNELRKLRPISWRVNKLLTYYTEVGHDQHLRRQERLQEEAKESHRKAEEETERQRVAKE